MAQRSIDQEQFGFGGRERAASSLDALASLVDWSPVSAVLDPLYPATKGEPAWPPLAMFKAVLLSIWYDLSDVRLAEVLDDRPSFRCFCGISANEATPERTAFVRFRRLLVAPLNRSFQTHWNVVQNLPFVHQSVFQVDRVIELVAEQLVAARRGFFRWRRQAVSSPARPRKHSLIREKSP